MINFNDARSLVAAWTTAALHSVETRVIAAWVWLKAKLADYERRAVLRLLAPAMLDALKRLHARVEDLEKRAYDGESAIAADVRRFLAKHG